MKTITLILLTFFTNYSLSQEYSIVGNSLLDRLYRDKNVIEINNHTSNINKILKLEKNFSNYTQYIIKNKKGLFIQVDASGRIYKAFDKKSDTIRFKRIDSTHFYGYNGSSVCFSYNDTLFSFGGDGFWRMNGQLRFFSEENHEWDIFTLNSEVAAKNIFFSVDTGNHQFYFLQTPFNNLVDQKKIGEFELYKMDLKTKKNEKIGKLSPFFLKLFSNMINYSFTKINSSNSILVCFDANNIFLIDIAKNKCKKYYGSLLRNIFYGNSIGIKIINSFEINNWLYYTKSNDTKLDSIQIDLSNFKETDLNLFEKEKTTYFTWIIGLLLILIVTFLLIKFYKPFKWKKTITQDSVFNYPDIDNDFNSFEQNLINAIFDKSLKGEKFSVTEFNNALGLNRKSLEIQKKIRTETINRINHKFRIKFEREDDLIEKVRSDKDRRFYIYFINMENGKMVKGN